MEAEKLGFKSIFISKFNQKGLDLKKLSIEVVFVRKVQEVVLKLF